MTPIIITGHGKFASAMEETIKYIFGEQSNIFYVDFDAGMKSKELENKINEVIIELNSEEIIFLTDIPGGTPFCTAVLLSRDNPKFRVYSGCSIPMIMSALEFASKDDLLSVDKEILSMTHDATILFEQKIKK